MSRAQETTRGAELADAGLTVALLILVTAEALAGTSRTAFSATANWALFVGFAALFAHRWCRRDARWRSGAFALDVAFLVVAVPFLAYHAGAIRLFRLMRLPLAGVRSVRSLRAQLIHRGALVVSVGAATTTWVGALVGYELERGRGLASFGDALWWSAATMTTVGYGDVSPVSAGGRLVAVALMVVGIAMFGLVTALFANWFLASPQPASAAALSPAPVGAETSTATSS